MTTTISGTTVTTTNFAGSGASLTGMTTQYMLVRDEKSQGTAGGSSVVGANTRVLNTVVANTISGASLSSNQVTLPAGVYLIQGRAPSIRSSDAKGYLYNVTTSALSIAGSTDYNSSGNFYAQTDTHITGVVTIGSTTVFEFRHLIESALSTEGLGIATYSSIAGVEVFAELLITKVS